MGRAVLQYSHCTSDTASRLGVRGAQARRAGHSGQAGARALGGTGARVLGGTGARALGAATRQLGLRHDQGARPRHSQTRPRHGRTRAAMRGHARPCAAWAWPVRTWGCCWAVGCALGALSLFLTRFDSVLFLSQFWGKFFQKKKIILGKKNLKKKSNKIRQNFQK